MKLATTTPLPACASRRPEKPSPQITGFVNVAVGTL